MKTVPRFLSAALIAAFLFALLPGAVLATEEPTGSGLPGGIIEPVPNIGTGEGVASGTPGADPTDSESAEDAVGETQKPESGSAWGVAEGVPSDVDMPEATADATDGAEIIVSTENGAATGETAETGTEEEVSRPDAPQFTLTRDFLLGIVAILVIVIAVLAVLLFQTRKTCRQLQAQVRQLQDSAPPKTGVSGAAPFRTEQEAAPKKPSIVTAPSFTVCGITGVHAGKRFPVRQQLGFGRDASCEIRYPAELNNISKVHCALIPNKEGVILVDLGSTGGTFLSDGSRLKPHHNYLLKRGDSFCLCNPEQSFRIE